MIHLFILLILRSLNGARNGFHYNKDENMRDIFSFICLMLMFAYPFLVFSGWDVKAFFILAPIIATMLYMVYGFGKYLHLWESVVATIFYITQIIFGADLLMFPLTAWFVNMFFKGFMNLVNGRKFILKVDITDDATGKTLGFPTPWGTFRRPRISNGYVSAGLGVILLLVWLFIPSDFRFYLEDAINWIRQIWHRI